MDSAGGSGAEEGLKSPSAPIFIWSLIVQDIYVILLLELILVVMS